MTTATAVPIKNLSNWVKSGTAVTVTSASDVARQAGLDWSVSLHNMTASYQIPGTEQNTPLPATGYRDWETDRKSTRLNSSHLKLSRMPSSA